jgi:Secretion system C-terminal sorting domain
LVTDYLFIFNNFTMKHFFIIIAILNGIVGYAQPYFVDTLNTLPILALPPMGNVFELPNNQGYAVSNFANYKLNIIYTDINGQRTGGKAWKIADSLNSSHSTRSSTKLLDGSYLIVTQELGACTFCNYGGVYCLRNDLQDTLWTKKYQYTTIDTTYSIYFDYAKTAADGTVWLTGTMSFPTGVISHITHINSDGSIIGQNHFPLSTGKNYVYNLLPAADGGCMIGLVEYSNFSNESDQVALVKVNAAGQQEWYKQYGNPNYRDVEPFILRAATPNEYWLVYNEGTSTGNSNFFSRIKSIRVNNTGIELETKYLIPYKIRGRQINDAYQKADGSVTFGMDFSVLGSNGHLFNFDVNMDSVWCKQIPIPNYYIISEELSAYHIIQSANGDYICGGLYNPNSALPSIFLTRLDSMGCLVVGTESVVQAEEVKIKVFPNPAKDYINIETPTENGVLYIYNAQGVLITKNNIVQNNTIISTTDWASGMYLYEYTNAELPTIHGKLQIIH